MYKFFLMIFVLVFFCFELLDVFGVLFFCCMLVCLFVLNCVIFVYTGRVF